MLIRDAGALWDALASFRRQVLGRMQPELTKLAGLELSVMQSLALQEIAHAGPLTVAALQARICRAQASTSQLVSQLERKGFVERRADRTDGRRTLVALGPRGRRLMADLEAARRRGFEEVVGSLPPSIQRQLMDALRATVDALEVS